MTLGKSVSKAKVAPQSAVLVPQSNVPPAAAARPAKHFVNMGVARLERVAVRPIAVLLGKVAAALSIAMN